MQNALHHTGKQNSYDRKAILLLIFGLLSCICINYNNLFLYFWNDESYSLKFFQLVPLKTTLTDYHDVNNHIGFNLLCNIYLKLTGQHDFLTLYYHPERLRIFLLLITCANVWMLWKLSLEIGNFRFALLNIVLLLTTLPFYNFSMQLRGYGLAMLLVMVIVQYLYRFYERGHWRNGMGVSVFTALIIYVHPANIFFAIAAFPATFILAFLTGEWDFKQKKRFVIGTWLAFGLGAIVGLALYMPMLKQLFFSPASAGLTTFYPQFWTKVFGANSYYIIGSRYLVLLFGMTGVWYCYKKGDNQQRRKPAFLSTLIVIYLGCYVISYFRKDLPVLRIFVPEMMLLLLGMSMGALSFIERLPARYQKASLAFLCISCIIIFPFELWKRNQVIDQCNITGIKSENLFANYYSHNYTPLPILDTLKKLAAQPDFLLLSITLNPHDYIEALQASQIPYYDYLHADSVIANHRQWYLITAGTSYFDSTYPSWKLQKISSGNHFNELYQVSHK